MHRPHITLEQHPTFLSAAGYGFSVWGQWLGTSVRTDAQVQQQASEAWPGRIAERGIFMVLYSVQCKTQNVQVDGGGGRNTQKRRDTMTIGCCSYETKYTT